MEAEVLIGRRGLVGASGEQEGEVEAWGRLELGDSLEENEEDGEGRTEQR